MNLDIDNMTFSALARFALLVDMAIEAEMIGKDQRVRLICDHAYDYANPKAVKNMKAGIKACQDTPRVYTSGHVGNQYGVSRL